MNEELDLPKLYKRTSGGKIQEWSIRVEENDDGTATMITDTGLQGGKHIEHRDKVTEGKNAGRKNATTPITQARLEAAARWRTQKEREHYGETVEESERKRSIAPMLAHAYEKHAKKVDWNMAHSQPKFDGNRCHAVHGENGIELITRKGLIVTTTPHINDYLKHLVPQGKTWDGELYVHGLAVTTLNGLLRKTQAGCETVKFLAYDLVSDEPFEYRYARLYKAFRNNASSKDMPAKLAKTERVNNEAEMMDFQTWCIEQGYEGAMLRHGNEGYAAGKRSDSLLKVKTFKDDEFKIVAVKEGRGSHAGMAVFTCQTKQGHQFDVTAPGSHDDKREFWNRRKQMVGKLLTVKFAGMTSTEAPVPFHPVAKCVAE
jgi:ATP-dependent DNA ligase